MFGPSSFRVNATELSVIFSAINPQPHRTLKTPFLPFADSSYCANLGQILVCRRTSPLQTPTNLRHTEQASSFPLGSAYIQRQSKYCDRCEGNRESRVSRHLHLALVLQGAVRTTPVGRRDSWNIPEGCLLYSKVADWWQGECSWQSMCPSKNTNPTPSPVSILQD